MNDNSKVRSIEQLRGIASLIVAWFHLTAAIYMTGAVGWSGAYGYLGVDAFFVVSGFVIPLSIHRSGSVGGLAALPSFMAKRLLRLYPPYIVSMGLVIGLWLLSERLPGFRGIKFEFDAVQFSSHFLLLSGYLGKNWYNPVYWTLAYEGVFYIAVCTFYGSVAERNSFPRFPAFVIAVVALVAVGLLPERFLLFLIGVACFRISVLGGGKFEAVSVGSALLCIIVLIGSERVDYAVAGLAAAIWILFDVSLKGRVGAVLDYLGKISYSLYLVHTPIGSRVVNLSRRLFSDSQDQWVQLLVSGLALGASVAFAILFYRFIERPAIRWSRSLSA